MLIKISYQKTSSNAPLHFNSDLADTTSYDREADSIPTWPFLLSAGVLSILFHIHFTLPEVLWSFSIFLEAAAIIPQLYVSFKHRQNTDTITSYYLYAIGNYRLFYLFNWIYRYQTENRLELIAFVCGVVQTLVYGVFFIVFMRRPFVNYGIDEEEFDEIAMFDEPDAISDDERTAMNSPSNNKNPIEETKVFGVGVE